jgi:hypothetical protein
MTQRLSIRLMLLVAALLAGCARSAPIRFYTLSPLTATRQKADAVCQGPTMGTVAVGPTTVPPYLDRPQIVRRLSANELDLLEFHQWAEPLQDSFGRILVENLTALLRDDGIQVRPWQGPVTAADYRVGVRLIALDNTGDDAVVLIAEWDILPGEGGESLADRRTWIEKKTTGEDIEALVAAQSEALAELSRQMAVELRSRVGNIP